ncbi:hypothetical protein FB446DRAFT_747593 [Lentinula raphanica]|nr:hypothetical protein FB446DRAFT_747593 [Lentinula raphanica]
MTTNANSCPQCGYFLQHNTPPALPCGTSRIEQLLSANEYPDEKEEIAFRSYIANAPCVNSHLDHRIASVEAELLKLRANKKSLASVIPKYQQALNPVKRLPVEILKLIFEDGSGYHIPAEEYFHSISDSLDVQLPLLVYRRVCRSWRNLVDLGMPKLWTRIKLQLNKPLPTHAHSLLSLYLHRSQGRLLAICLNTPRSNSMDFATGIFVGNFFKGSSSRWKSLYLRGGSGLDTVLAMPEYSYEHLESVHIRRIDMLSVSFYHCQLPKLTTWTSIWDGPAIAFSPSPFFMITNYTISGVWNNSAINIVQHLHFLRTLSIQNFVPGALSVSEVKDINLPVLEELYIREDSDDNRNDAAIAAVLDSMTCPALTTLSLFTSGQLVEPFQQFEERSDFKLKRFAGSEHTGVFVEALRNCDALERIDIEGTYTTRATKAVLAQLYIPFQSAAISSANTHFPLSSPSPTPSLATPKVTFPNLRQLQFRLGDLFFVENFLDRAYSSLYARLFSKNIIPLELAITTADEQAQKILHSPQMKKFAALGVTLKIMGV